MMWPMVHKSNVFVKHNRLVRTLKLSHAHNPIRFINAKACAMYFLLRRPWRPLRGDGPANLLARFEAPQDRQRPEVFLAPTGASQIAQVIMSPLCSYQLALIFHLSRPARSALPPTPTNPLTDNAPASR